ncbi:MAG: ABC transporter substrate-binding protein [Proteobacteria bacterium]|nr:ABC transporter substrate-binding protein [Pseudomonadota bacterium]MBU1449575.1 ABC transporter substrate-binding protein [Pseudomonadota bacterium]MBU2469027.1 ABC transporter substrate-binding protein [Pseudomonadota bacterium]MBU2516872.1 ABC transporter substrate-binding protein [Pseudomonadota bacterium]
MAKDKNQDKAARLNRRDFMKKVGQAAALAGAATVMPHMVRPAAAAKRDYILVGYLNPSTGPVAAFGEPTPWSDDHCLAAINKDGGIYVEEYGKKVPVKVKIVDSESSGTKSAELAARLILHDKVDLLMPCHTPGLVNPACAIAERYKVPCIAVDAPFEDWMPGGPYHWSFLHFWSLKDNLTDVFFGMWDQLDTNRVVGALWPNDVDGTLFAEYFTGMAKERGYKFIDQGRFPFFQKDFGSQISAFKKAKVEIVTGALIPPDFATFLMQAKQLGLKPKAITVAKGLMFPSSIEALGGDMGKGVTTELWWSPHHPFKSSLTGATAKQLCDAYEKAKNKQWTPPLGFKHSGWELVADAFTRARSVNKEKVRNALAQTDLNTIVGPVKYNKQNWSPTPLVGAQWVKGKKWPWVQEIVYNKPAPMIPVGAKQRPMNG